MPGFYARLDNKISNLELVTAKENVRHARDSKLMTGKSGQENYNAKITEEIALKIYDRFIQGVEIKYIMKEFDLTFTHVVAMRKGKIWKHLFEQYGHLFKKICPVLKNTKEQVKQAYLLLPAHTNKKISDNTGIDISLVRNLRKGNAYKFWVEEIKQELEQEQQLLK